MVVFGGRVMKTAEEETDGPLQLHRDLVIGGLADEFADADAINHSCDPNLGILGQILLVTIRDIQPGEEVCFDYAMCLAPSPDVLPYRIQCRCGSPNCRGVVTDSDWKITELQRQYHGWFSWHVQQLVDESRKQLICPKTS